jgi:hypothetical protein
MTQILVAIHHADDYDPSVAEGDAMSRDIDAIDDEVKAAGVRVFVGGLQPAGSAASLRAQPDGEVLTSSGPYLKTKEHVGACGCWKPRTWTWRLPAGAGPVAYRAKAKVRPFH